MGFTDDRQYLWAGGLDDSKIYVFDIATDPAQAEARADDRRPAGEDGLRRAAHLLRAARPHARSGPLQRQGQGRRHRHGALQQQGRPDHQHDMPTPTIGGVKGDGYGYDLAVNPAKNVLLTSSFTGYKNYMRDARRAHEGRRGDEALRQHDGGVGPEGDEADAGAAACRARRWRSAGRSTPGHNWAITAAALTSKLWLVKAGRGRQVGRRRRSPPSAIPRRSRCPSTSASPRDGKGLWVNTFMDGMTRYFDLTEPGGAEADLREAHRQAGEHDLAELGRQARLHHLRRCSRNWDKKGADNEQFLRAFKLGRQGADAGLRGRLHEGEARARRTT